MIYKDILAYSKRVGFGKVSVGKREKKVNKSVDNLLKNVDKFRGNFLFG